MTVSTNGKTGIPFSKGSAEPISLDLKPDERATILSVNRIPSTKVEFTLAERAIERANTLYYMVNKFGVAQQYPLPESSHIGIAFKLAVNGSYAAAAVDFRKRASIITVFSGSAEDVEKLLNCDLEDFLPQVRQRQNHRPHRLISQDTIVADMFDHLHLRR